MNALATMEEAASGFRARLLAEPGCRPLDMPAPTHGGALKWDNLLLAAPRFRRAHVEHLRVDEHFAVLHVCVFPHLHDETAIFGFDMLAGPTRVTGIFLDLSPVRSGTPTPSLRDVCGSLPLTEFEHPRSLPPWAAIFSEDVVAVRPQNGSEIDRAVELGARALDFMLRAPIQTADARQGQANYIAGQRRNHHTIRMLASLIGQHAAQSFIEEVLFPEVPAIAG